MPFRFCVSGAGRVLEVLAVAAARGGALEEDPGVGEGGRQHVLGGHYTILYYTILYHTIPYYTILYDTIRYYTVLYYAEAAPGAGRGAAGLPPIALSDAPRE